MLNVVTLNAGNYQGRGSEYANKLSRAVRRNLSLPYRFICFTDDDAGLLPDIVARPLPHPGLIGLMNKLALFNPTAFEFGERILWLDLDTIISGNIDEIASYAGKFAMIEDLYFPGRIASGVMAWQAGVEWKSGAPIWESYADAGYPNIEGGDQVWIEACRPRVDILQDLYPGQIASYKASGCQLAPQTRIVCFHGHPRPHHISAGWVPSLWNGESDPAGNAPVRLIH